MSKINNNIFNLENESLGSLCSLLSEANIQIYKYENQKWWGRKENKATDKEINEWDEISRSWNEKRSAIKNKIDQLLKELLINIKNDNFNQDTQINTKNQNFSFQILPISLMIDMMTIENIKIFDLSKKNNEEGIKKATSRRDALKESIDRSIKEILKTGVYDLKSEARTF
ncbi:hypothetical protein GYA19_04380 [Candidatus Beckwithbacteria bacterium]|nr:hypothetical protein [Candidatus Beckwithbacteria bacterium]